ncbi:MAG: bifunctional chorismate mutase/prephenate dehydratase [Clostridiales bacterium]|nr:bifunctional chorismate mutase/prephenate dehydratase [Clostridiales bacterium]
MDLKDLREQIDLIDDKIIELYKERMALSKQVGIVKAQIQKAVQDGNREKEIVYRLSQKCPEEIRFYVKELYDAIFHTSKAYQNKFTENTSKVKSEIDKIIENPLKDFPVDGTVACQGVNGAYSGKATEKMFPISDITYFKTFDAVFNAVDKGLCEFGVLPIENSTAGSVSEVYDLMKKHEFHIVRSVRVQIDHCLAVKNGATIKDIRKVISHQQALSQCSEFIKKLGVNAEPVENTAVGARLVAEGDDLSIAVLCSKECAESYNLKILEPRVQDSEKNYTRFICITKDRRIYKGADKISVMTSLAHTPGSLNKIISRFYAFGLNLTKIESRPIEGSDFEFMFYFDFEGDILDPQVRNLIAELDNGSDKFVLLGSYKESL